MSKINKSTAQNMAASPLYFLGKVCWSVVRLFFMLEMAFVILYPIMYMLSMAFRSSADMYDASIVWIPKNFTFENFTMCFDALKFDVAFKNTVIIALGCTLLQVVVCTFTGYSFARFKYKGSKLLFFIAIFTVIIPPQMINLPNYLLFRDFDLFGIVKLATGAGMGNMLDKYITVFLLAALGVGLRSGLFILIFSQYFKGIPTELEEAAMIDGCGYFRTFINIMVPNAGGPMLTTFLFSMVWYWNDFYTMSTFFTEIKTLSVNLANIGASLQNVMSTAAYNPYKVMTIKQAACIIVMLPIFVLFILLQKRFVRSMVNSGLVG